MDTICTMIFSFTNIVYIPVSLAISIVAFRFFKDWKETSARDAFVYFMAFATLTLVCLTGVLAGSVFPGREGITLMLIVSNVLVTLSNAFFAYLYFYYRLPRISAWWAFVIVLVFGSIVTEMTLDGGLNPALEASGGINWGIPLKIGILRSIIYFLGMLPLISIHLKGLKDSEAQQHITKNLFLVLFLSMTLLVVIFDFIIEPLTGIQAFFSEIVILALAVIGMLVYFVLHESMLARTERRFRLLVDNMRDLVCLTDMDGVIHYANRSHASILGYQPQNLKGKNILELVFPEDRPVLQKEIARIAAGEAPPAAALEFRLVHAGKQEVWVESFGFFELEAEKRPGAAAQMAIASRDISNRRLLENSLRQAQKMEAVGLLAGGVAHDFNNLLTVINGYSDMLLARLNDDHALASPVKQIQQAGQRAASLTRQLLAFSRKQLLNPEAINMNNLTKNMEKMLRRLIREDIELITEYDPGLKMVLADPGQVEQVILNLVINACDAMPDGGRITIETKNVYMSDQYVQEHPGTQSGEHVMIAISDTGSGMDAETRERIFEPFFTTKEKGKGTGLGLSTVYGIVKQSNGNIWVYSEPGQGTVFKVYLPAVRVQHKNSVRSSRQKEYRGNETILLIEDDAAVREMTRMGLSGLGYRILEAADGAQALNIIEQNKDFIQLILTDVVMPNMNGRQVADSLATTVPHIKMLFMSGYTDNAIVRHGILEKDINFIQKPFTTVSLARKIREILEQG